MTSPRAQLDASQFATGYAEGPTMTLEQAVEYALAPEKETPKQRHRSD
jgi:hypothetical protein